MSDRDRGVSTAVSYSLSLVIVTLLMTGVFWGMSDLVEGQQDRAIRSEFSVLGNRIAADIGAVDRMVLAAATSPEAELTTDIPSIVAGENYRVILNYKEPDGPLRVNLTTAPRDVTTTIEMTNETPVAETTVDGGDLLITYNGSMVVVRSA